MINGEITHNSISKGVFIIRYSDKTKRNKNIMFRHIVHESYLHTIIILKFRSL